MKRTLKVVVATCAVLAVLCGVVVVQLSIHSHDAAWIVDRQLSGTTEQQSTEHESLFGALDSIKPNRFISSLLLVITAVLCVEYVFHVLHLFTEDSPFHKVVRALEKELMIVGCTAFIFKVSINVTHFLSDEWFFALEFSDLLVPFFSFTNCIISVILILTSLLQCDTWSRAYHLKIEEILDYSIDDHGVSVLSKWWAPFSSVVGEMEFRIFHDIFCENYDIKREAFAFDEYVQLVYEKFVLAITQLRFVSWTIFVALLLFVLAGRAMASTQGKCEEGDLHCVHLQETKIFIIFGSVLCLLSTFLGILCRYYEKQFIARHGIVNFQSYPNFLMGVESKRDSEITRKRFNEEDLKRVIQDTKLISEKSSKKLRHQQCQAFIRRLGLSIRSVVPIRVNPEHNTEMVNDAEYSAMMKLKHKPSLVGPNGLNDIEDSARSQDDINMKHKAEHLDELFFLSRPDLFFGSIQIIILPISLYFAMWIVNFSAVHITSGWKFLAILPGLVSMAVFVYMIRTAALLKAVYMVDKDAMLEVIEQTEGSRTLGETIREKLLQRITVMGEPYEGLKKLFGEIDQDSSNKLSRLEFEALMDKLDINFSRKKWKQIYHEIDRNYDDQVSFDEFIFFLFPDNDISMAMEFRRMKIVKSRLEAKVNLDKHSKDVSLVGKLEQG